MSKLFKLKEWVTVDDAARYLSKILDEPVREADVLQLALDGHIKLSVHFPNHARAQIGRVVPFKDVPIRKIPSLDCKSIITYVDGYPLTKIKEGGRRLAEDSFVVFDSEIVPIEGLWDLAMCGNERLDIEHEFQQLIGGPEITLVNLNGTFLNRSDGVWAALQDSFKNWYDAFPDAKGNRSEPVYFPAAGLGEDCTRVVRTSEILAFQSRLEEPASDRPLSSRERDTLLTIIAVLCKDLGYEYTKHAKTAGLIRNTAAGMGLSIGETTIEGHLKRLNAVLHGT